VRGHRSGGDRSDRVDHRILYRHGLPPGALGGQRLDHRSWHQCDPGARRFDGSDRASRTGHLRGNHRLLPARRSVRPRDRGHRDARLGRHGDRARRLRSGDRQRRRDRRNGGTAQGGAQRRRR
jgi:hypothetical protein